MSLLCASLIHLEADQLPGRRDVAGVELLEPDRPHRLRPDHVPRAVALDLPQVVGVVRPETEDGTLVDGVDGVDDVPLREARYDVRVVLPDLEDGVLSAFLLQRLDDISVDVLGEIL